MKTILSLVLLALCSSTFAQKNFIDQPYIETGAMADTLVMPDRIYLTILLSEADTKGKKSVEDMEKAMDKKLKELNIDTKKDLTLMELGSNYKKYFLSGQKVNKAKAYSLLVRDAVTAGKVLAGLESVDIANVRIREKSYSKEEELNTALKVKAIAKARKDAQAMATAAGKKLGDVLFIAATADRYYPNYDNAVLMAAAAPMEDEVQPLEVDFEGMTFSAFVRITFKMD
jgi:uncharacterized protein YggE